MLPGLAGGDAVIAGYAGGAYTGAGLPRPRPTMPPIGARGSEPCLEVPKLGARSVDRKCDCGRGIATGVDIPAPSTGLNKSFAVLE